MNPGIRDCVRRMTAYVPGEQPSAPGLIKLNTNENPYPPSPRVAEALARFAADRLRLYPDPVCRRLRERIAAIHGCAVDQVFVGNGSDEILASCLRAFVEPDGAAGYFEPSYSLYPVLADAAGLAKRPVPLDAAFVGRLPAGYACSLFFLTNPNAPTGLCHGRSAVEDCCRGAGGVVLLDEAYVDFADADCMDLALARPNVLAARTLSKSFSLAGLRLGYVVGPADLIGALFKIKDSYNIDALAQELALAALNDLPHMRANVARIRATRARTAAALERCGCEVYPSQANFLWVRPRALPAERYAAALRAANILIRHFPGPRTGDCVRITVGTDAEMDTLLARTREAMATR